MSESLSISFPKRDRPLYKLIKQTHREAKKKAPGGKLRLVDHARTLLRKGLDCTCATTGHGSFRNGKAASRKPKTAVA